MLTLAKTISPADNHYRRRGSFKKREAKRGK